METKGEGQRQTVAVRFQPGGGSLKDLRLVPSEDFGGVDPEGFILKPGDPRHRFAAKPLHPAEVFAGLHGAEAGIGSTHPPLLPLPDGTFPDADLDIFQKNLRTGDADAETAGLCSGFAQVFNFELHKEHLFPIPLKIRHDSVAVVHTLLHHAENTCFLVVIDSGPKELQ